MEKHMSHNAAMAQSKSITNSNQMLPTLKTYLESEEMASLHKPYIPVAKTGPRVETQQFERSRHFTKDKEGSGSPSVSNLEKNKQYLEQLRQLASIRHQKKMAGAQQHSVKTKKNDNNKTASALLRAQTVQNSPPNVLLNGPIQPFNTRSSVPKLPHCNDTRGTALPKQGSHSELE